MRVVFRADASIDIGAGHVMRCLALADELKHEGELTHFICREQAGHLCDLIEKNGHAVSRLPAATDVVTDAALSADAVAGADWLVVDHYGLDAAWESALRKQARRILVIDDLADRRHDCDLLLDQNLQPDVHARYASLLPAACQTLFGPRYALLRPQFAAHRAAHQLACNGAVRRILVFFGGADACGETLKALAAIEQLQRPDIAVDVVIGQANPHRAEIEHACRALQRARLHCQVEDMAALMAAADLAIGAGGTTSWERCCLGLPTLAIGIADNQLAPAAALAEAGGQLYLGAAAQVSVERLAQAVAQVIQLPELLVHLARQGMQRVDGRGAGRVANRLLADQIRLRPARPSDCAAVYQWRNHPDTRACSFSSEAISMQAHADWYAGVLNNPARILLIGEQAGQPVGVLRFDLGAAGVAVVSLYLVPGQAGRGYGSRMLLAGNRWLAAHRPEVVSLEAAIHADNAASIGAFQAAGFALHHAVYRKELDVSL